MGIIYSTENLLFSDYCKANTRIWIRLYAYVFGWKDPYATLGNAIPWYFRPQTHEAMIRTDERNRIIQDFIETIHATDDSFDVICRLLFIDSKLWASVYYYRNKIYTDPIFKDIEDIEKYTSKPIKPMLLEEILRFAFVNGLRYCDCSGSVKIIENMIDFPLKPITTFGHDCIKRPLYLAVCNNLPHIVRLLLNYGARIPYEDVCTCREHKFHPLVAVLDSVKEILCNGRKSNVMNYKKRFIMSLKTLLVDISHTTALKKHVSDVLEEVSGGEEIAERIPSLKHIIRTQIRLRMKSNHSICKKNVFDNLGIPVTLVHFLKIDERIPFLEMYPPEELRTFVEF